MLVCLVLVAALSVQTLEFISMVFGCVPCVLLRMLMLMAMLSFGLVFQLLVHHWGCLGVHWVNVEGL